MRIRQPGVQREQRNLHREGDKESEKEPERGGREVGNLSAGDGVVNHRVIERAGLGVKPDDGRQHEHRGNHGEQEKFYGRVNSPLVPPNADEQRHGHQGGFPEDVEQKHVQRHEDADHRRLQHQHQHEEFLHAIVHRAPGDQHAQRHEECGQQHQPQRDAVNAQVVMNVGIGDPDCIRLKLKTGCMSLETRRQK